MRPSALNGGNSDFNNRSAPLQVDGIKLHLRLSADLIRPCDLHLILCTSANLTSAYSRLILNCFSFSADIQWLFATATNPLCSLRRGKRGLILVGSFTNALSCKEQVAIFAFGADAATENAPPAVIDQQTPEFKVRSPRSVAKMSETILESLNELPKRAVLNAFACVDYWLINGMSDTALIVALGKSSRSSSPATRIWPLAVDG